jgi:hypothetical protein
MILDSNKDAGAMSILVTRSGPAGRAALIAAGPAPTQDALDGVCGQHEIRRCRAVMC